VMSVVHVSVSCFILITVNILTGELTIVYLLSKTSLQYIEEFIDLVN
jgi:hypothetical protein